jgi:hypothetical protein
MKKKNKHISFLLDISSSMFLFEGDDPIVKNVKMKMISKNYHRDSGDNVRSVSYDSSFDYVVDEVLYISKCVKSIKSLVSLLDDNYEISLSTFSDEYKNILYYLKPKLFWINKKAFIKGNETQLYDAIKQNLKVVSEAGNDVGSKKSLENLINYIKKLQNVNIIIVAINLSAFSTTNMKKIIESAKFGKLLHTNDDVEKYGFDSISSTISKVKEITLSMNNFDNKDYKKDFNL